MRTFQWTAEKNALLATQRGITFEEIVERVESGATVVEAAHPDQEKYPHQKILIVDVDGYAYLVPFVGDENVCFLNDLSALRRRAACEGIPYQTLVGSDLHKFANGLLLDAG